MLGARQPPRPHPRRECSRARAARHQIANASRLEIGNRQRQKVAEEAGTQFDIDSVGGVGKKVGPQNAEDSFENRNGDESDNEYSERTQGATGQHLVDDDLEEQRRDEREQLQEKRSDEDLAQANDDICGWRRGTS